MIKYFRNIIIFIRLIRESLTFALSSIIANKMRTFLSLLGVTIGIFAIISMFTVIDSLENNISESLSELGNDIIYIQQFPWSDDPNYPWWKYRQRPKFTYGEYSYIQKNARTASATVMTISFQRQIRYKSKTASNSYIYAVTSDWDKMITSKIAEGRFFSSLELQRGSNVAILGATVADQLFGKDSPIGKNIKIAGKQTRIIGVFQQEGDNLVSFNQIDDCVTLPFQFARSMINIRHAYPTIQVKAKPNVSTEEMGDEVKRLLRAYRRLKPIQEDNFALNEMSLIAKISANIFGTINTVGWIIGLFSILVGGFGIANIMFVSVKERTNIIGIQKALGAKNYFVLTQFLFEATVLAIIGGIIGLLLIWGGSSLLNTSSSFKITLSLSNIILGLLISAIVGITSGFIPAFMASKLDPVVAINSK